MADAAFLSIWLGKLATLFAIKIFRFVLEKTDDPHGLLVKIPF